MNALHLLAVGMVCMVTASALPDVKKEQPDNTKLLVGKWEVTKNDKGGLKVGDVLEFSKDGKKKLVVKDRGAELILEFVYEVEGNKIYFTRKEGDKEVTKNFTIKKVSEQELVLEAKNAVATEFKRVK